MSALASVSILFLAIRDSLRKARESKTNLKWLKIGLPVLMFGLTIGMSAIYLYSIPVGFAFSIGTAFPIVLLVGLAGSV